VNIVDDFPNTTVESFCQTLDAPETSVNDLDISWVPLIERQLLVSLPQAHRLLRWAIVNIEHDDLKGTRLICEGAYLKKNLSGQEG
jgi:hypothetical protein